MRKIAITLRGTTAACVLLCAGHAFGQRIQFPSMVPGTDPSGAGTAMQTPPPSPYTPPPTTAAPPPVTTPGTGPPPPATFGGTVQPTPTWDPYGSQTAVPPPSAQPYYNPPTPGPTGQPPALFPEGLPWSQGTGPYPYGSPVEQVQRFFQDFRFEYTWLVPTGSDAQLGINQVELFGSFAFPLFHNTENPLFVTPGFSAYALEGPVTTAPEFADLPGQLYDAYLDFSWQPTVTPWLAGDLGARIGVYSDFDMVTSDSVRIMGRALGVMTLTPSTQISVGVVYLDRLRVKLLPSGGVICTPTPERRYEIVFPNPKLSKRLMDIGTTEWWCYIAGEYGGGSWSGARVGGDANFLTNPEFEDRFDYNDYRAFVGFEWTALSGMRGFFEGGYVFEREIVYKSGLPAVFDLEDTVMLRAGVVY